ncbi:MAG: hypothetical protein M1826_002067 [Phylliscum demangeonii]|nr:MAG: hypothetical protein M1826_002067 [Phylliscum demangeonii]
MATDSMATTMVATTPVNGMHSTVLLDYLVALLQTALGASREDLESDGSLLAQRNLYETEQRCTRFATDAQVALYVNKAVLPTRETNGDELSTVSPSRFSYTLSSDISFSPTTTASIALLKRPQALDLSEPISSQVQILNLPGLVSYHENALSPSSFSPYELLHALLHSAVAPYFDACTKGQSYVKGKRSRTENDDKSGIPATKKKIAELELSLLHLQQNIEIPDLYLPLHPAVQTALELARSRGARPAIEDVPSDLLADSGFANEIQATVNNWIKSIRAITDMSRDVASGSAAQEINFWLSMESALEGVEAQLRGEGVLLTMEILRLAKRYQATYSFSTDTGLKEATEKVQRYNQLMRDFPLDELLSATSLPKVQDALHLVFVHLNKKLRICPYPVNRALPLLEAISDDLDSKLHSLLNGTGLMFIDFRDFQTLIAAAEAIGRTWDEHVREFTNIAREMTRRRNEKFIPIKVTSRHGKTQERLAFVTTFRVNHEQLQRTIAHVLNVSSSTHHALVNGGTDQEESSDSDAVEEVAQAFAALKDVNVLDVSPEGTQIWAQAVTAYTERTSRVENSIIASLRDQLATVKSAGEMFRVFSKFNSLFVRPNIRGAVIKYQTELIDRVKHDLAALHERFKQQYGHSEAHAMAQLRDLPPVAGAIIWARQIERRLDGYMKKVEDVLGTEWTKHAEGQKLQLESQLFRKKLDTRPIVDSWLSTVIRRKLSISGRLFNINRNRAAGNVLELSVNFDSQVIALFKEVRNLTWLNYPIPHAISNTSKDAKRVYPYAVSLMETVRTFAQNVRQIEEMAEISTLLAGYQHEVQALIVKGIPLRWESFVHAYDLTIKPAPYLPNGTADRSPFGGRSESKHAQFVRNFAAAVTRLQTKTSTLASINEEVQRAKTEMNACAYDAASFRKRIEIIQTAVDQLNLENFANLGQWVHEINSEVEIVLLARLKHALLQWVAEFESSSFAEDLDDKARKRGHSLSDDDEVALQRPKFEQLEHAIMIRDQVISLDPPLEFARASWLSQLHNWLGVVGDLPRIRSSRYEMKVQMGGTEEPEPRFSTLPNHCVDELVQAYTAVELKLHEVGVYVDKWLQFQSLWDLQSEQVFGQLGEDLASWHQLLLEIRKTRATFDTNELSRSFGNLLIDYEQVQTKVNAKYDQWQHEIVVKFGARLGTRMREVYEEIQAARRQLESELLDASSTAQAVTFITAVQLCEKKVAAWAPEMLLFTDGQTTLGKQRYQFGNDWLYVDHIEHEWTALNERLARKQKQVQDQIEALRANVIAEDQVVSGKIVDIIARWGQEKPVSGTVEPEEASSILRSFESQLTQLQAQADMVTKAGEALDLPVNLADSLSSIIEEVHDFQGVWAALSRTWTSLDELKETLWSSVQPRKLRQSLDALIQGTKDMPSRMRQYAAFEYIQGVLRQLLKVNPLLSELKSEAVRERHWIKIFKSLKPGKRYSAVSMSLGDVWDLNLVASETIIKDVITQAQGEMALEEFLKQVRETWTNYVLDLVNYQNKCRLIRGWDDLFAKCSENLNSLQAMKHSPYYKEFEEEALAWEGKLNRVHVLFDVWIDVQRQWVYLEGVFTGNADIKHLLPVESNRFNNMNTEFSNLLKKVYKAPYVLEVLNISGIQKSLERLAELLHKIQKALGEYLERERVTFPRFYFVGDEDLLEIIGNSNDLYRISKHFSKMFAGLSGILLEEQSTVIGVTSKEGEEVRLKRSISLLKTPKINEWLALLEEHVKHTLAELLAEAVSEFEGVFHGEDVDAAAYTTYVARYPAQVMVLATQVVWTAAVETALGDGGAELTPLHERMVRILQLLAAAVLDDLNPIERKKYEHLITESVHQRDIIKRLIECKASSSTHYYWLIQMRYNYTPEGDYLLRLRVKMANADLTYGFEYLGVSERLVRTPLTDTCFLTLTQALCQRLGGSPYGPAGTGKTETVKALGVQLGRFTLVFCCDDTFDFQAMGRIFLGICQVGAWGCFDEFNRLEERILSAVSQQIQNIQLGLKQLSVDPKAQIDLAGRQLQVSGNTGIFITMNPGYAGRSNLPDNLKKLFRSVAMSKPDKELIAEVMLFSQGFRHAKQLSKHTVPFFDRCSQRLSKQSHYDFGLRALKSVLVSSGHLKRGKLTQERDNLGLEEEYEPQIVVQSLRETIAPKLLVEDVEILKAIEAESFPGVEYIPAPLAELREVVSAVASEQHLVLSEPWMAKSLQLYQILSIHHGVMMVGESGAGKSSIWKVLLQALQRMEGVESVSHIIDSKVMSKESLYGTLDSTTREWTDGLFTSILRKIIDNLRGELYKRHWIVFDGDVDPEWVENLNSVLDDNKLLTLPNGERLNLPSNVRIMFEVGTLRYATPATVSRCGMVWFSKDIVAPTMMIAQYLGKLKAVPFDDVDEDNAGAKQASDGALALQIQTAHVIEHHLAAKGFAQRLLGEASTLNHIMDFTEIRVLDTLFSLINRTCRALIEYNMQHLDFPLESEQIETFVVKKLLLAIVWSFAGDSPLSDRKAFGKLVAESIAHDLPLAGDSMSLIDFDVSLPQAEWTPWQSQVPQVEVNPHSVTQTDIVIPTLDTIRHEDVLYAWLAEHRPLLLCGPPGSGKTMTLFSALRKLPNMEVVGLNFSSATTPDLLVKTFEQYCEYRKTVSGVVLSPTQIGRWLVLFCDEINLPAPDKYGTQRAISFLRQLVEQRGFWRTSDKAWVTLERIQFVGACNPPTDAGRTPLALRFLRHAPLIMVDYPGELSLLQIYGTFNSAVLKIIPLLKAYTEPLTKAMVQFYLESQSRFTSAIQPHYIYSPRELTRWVRGLYEAIRPLDSLSLEGLVRIWAHEALRLFHDRLISEEERKWTISAAHRIALEHFPSLDEEKALGGPILYSNWLSKHYVPVEREELRSFVKARLKTFCEEEVDVPLILFNDVLEHVLRIDRVFRQPQGHLILIGVSGSGKTTLSRFVAWMNGLKVYQIKIHGRYSAADFDEDLRDVLRRSGCKGEKICFIMDEANVLDSAFLERMNTLLANAEVPGLFEGDEFASLMTACKEGAQRQGLLLDSQEELYKWFTQQIVKNLHVVFTMNPPENGLSSRAATSPALFNRCVLVWFGDWSDQALFQVGLELTQSVDLDQPNFVCPDTIPLAYRGLELPASYRPVIVNAMVYIHHSLHDFNRRLQKQQMSATFLTPRHFLDFVAQFVKLYDEKREELEEQQRHLNTGLDKLRATVDKVREMKVSLADKKGQLERKDAEANEKLLRMVADQREAEQRKATSLEVQAALEKQEEDVASRREHVLHDLARAEPAVVEAQKSVSNIKRQHLTEVRSMGSPPAGVKLALEAVCTLLGHKVDTWKTIQGIIRRDDFIASIVNYDNERQMTRNHRLKMHNDYLSNEDFTFEKVNRASKACGPLVQWVQAQVLYSEILDRVGPLRDEVAELEEQALQTKAEAQAIDNTIRRLEQSITNYKTEYAALISEAQEIKNEMSRVQRKVDRSVKLLDSLSSERTRWADGSKSFETQLRTLVGDVLVAAAFLAYGGLFDQQFRRAMMDDWLGHLSLAGVEYKLHNPVAEYLSSADERLKWQENSLPVDELCTENAIILKRFNRYPLIIDPSGRVTEFLQKEFHGRRLTVTSFLDDSFTKQLESSLRFGNPILIQDAEHLDPVLNHVLNKEYQKTGGRVLIQLGKQEIDFSPAFKLYLSTRDPAARFAPDVCSRTTFVNFTVTQSSLQTQSLNDVLKSERPDVDERRSNLIKLQGEFNVNLRRLERKLLQALNESRGNILDDDNLIESLEVLKREAAVISQKMAETEGVMAEVEAITLQYKIIAQSCSAIFAVLGQLHQLNHFYQFSLRYFMDIFHSVLYHRDPIGAEANHRARVDSIVQRLFVTTYQRTSLGLLQQDRVALALLLAQVAPYHIDKGLLEIILDDDPGPNNGFFDRSDSAAWDKFLTEEAAEDFVPNLCGPEAGVMERQLRSLLVVKLFRLDRFVPAAERYVTAVFGSDLRDHSGDLHEVVQQVSCTTPIALSSTPGFDASFKVSNLVGRMRAECAHVAMGSNESLSSADQAISAAAAVGSWVLIKNVHLAPTWLQSLEKRLNSLKPHADFRLFLSMEISPTIPGNLLRACRVLIYEQPAGIRANMKDSLSSLAERAARAPVERARIYLLLSFLHAVLQERLRYAPHLGWKGLWEFNDSDYECAAFIIDTWVESAAKGRSNVGPQQLPWDLIRVLVHNSYGGKIDDDRDQGTLRTLIDHILNVAAFEHGYQLVPALADSTPMTAIGLGRATDEGLTVPEATGIGDYLDWVHALPEREAPTYLGLPAHAERLLLEDHGRSTIRKVRLIRHLLDEGEQLMAEPVDASAST